VRHQNWQTRTVFATCLELSGPRLSCIERGHVLLRFLNGLWGSNYFEDVTTEDFFGPPSIEFVCRRIPESYASRAIRNDDGGLESVQNSRFADRGRTCLDSSDGRLRRTLLLIECPSPVGGLAARRHRLGGYTFSTRFDGIAARLVMPLGQPGVEI
jgi:hypothetical protein